MPDIPDYTEEEYPPQCAKDGKIHAKGAIVSQRPIAVFKYDCQTYLLGVGDEIGGWYIDDIKPRYVILVSPDGTRVVQLMLGDNTDGKSDHRVRK